MTHMQYNLRYKLVDSLFMLIGDAEKCHNMGNYVYIHENVIQIELVLRAWPV